MGTDIDILGILDSIPHRYPFLLVDGIVESSEDRIVGFKNVTFNEWYFQGHFPGDPIVPGVLILEGLSQCAGVLILRGVLAKKVYFASMDGVKFRRPVRPGDRLLYEVTILKKKSKFCQFEGKAYIQSQENQLACQAVMMARFME